MNEDVEGVPCCAALRRRSKQPANVFCFFSSTPTNCRDGAAQNHTRISLCWLATSRRPTIQPNAERRPAPSPIKPSRQRFPFGHHETLYYRQSQFSHSRTYRSFRILPFHRPARTRFELVSLLSGPLFPIWHPLVKVPYPYISRCGAVNCGRAP